LVGGERLEAAHEILRGSDSLTEHDAKRLFGVYRVPVTREHVVTSAKDAVHAAEALGFPVVMKGLHSLALHKSEYGLVRTNVRDRDAVVQAFNELSSLINDIPGEGASAGVLVSEQVQDGVEMIVGVVTDPIFGPTVMVGLGGVAAELSKDVQFRVPPFTRAEAARMVHDLRFSQLLFGYRGSTPKDVGALIDVIMSFQDLAVDLEGLVSEVEANPVFVLQHGAVAADALVVRVPGTVDSAPFD
jgi:succinyl-CoA synthetase beta subunit